MKLATNTARLLRSGRTLGLTLAFVAASSVQAETPSRPHRVVSLDHCADEYVLSLADRGQIAAVSPAATREFSYYADRAQGLPRTGAGAEEILKLSPDLVVRFFGGGYRTEEMLARFGIPVLDLTDGTTFDSVRDNLRKLGTALDQDARAAEIVSDMDRRLAAVATRAQGLRTGAAPRAAYVTPGGVTAGRGTMVDTILHAAGLTNMANIQGRSGWVHFDLETLVLAPPQLIVASFFDHATVRSDHWTLASHSVLRDMMRDVPTIILPSRLMSCGGPFSVDAVERIQDALAMSRTGPSTP